jgi:heme exporter protein C
MFKNWWKALCVVLLIYTVYEGFLVEVPSLPVLNETIRNLYFHVGMWFAMIAVMTGSVIYAIRFLVKKDLTLGIRSTQMAHVGVLLGVLGLLTGMLWGNYTWGSPWPDDPKIHGAAVSVLIYLAYFTLQSTVTDIEKKNTIGSAYNVFAYLMMVLFLIVYPRLSESLHPGNGGNPAFNTYDLDNEMRKVFYPAILGWILLGFWVAQLNSKIEIIRNNKIIKDINYDS